LAKGIIFNVQRFSLHDGPGIRTTVFLKGCPLTCRWCQNPEGICRETVLFRYENKCIICGSCVKSCPEEAFIISNGVPQIDRSRCSLCLNCVNICPVEAIQAAGRIIDVKSLVKEVLKDRIIFEESGGGVTVSGGEPFSQPVFLLSFLKALKNENVHTVIETSGFAPWHDIEAVLKWTDLILYDLKLIDREKSKIYTGTDSRLMLENLKMLLKNDHNVRIRMPLVPTVNDDRESLKLAADFLLGCGANELEIIPYHNLGTSKYVHLDMKREDGSFNVPTAAHLSDCRSTLEGYGISIISEVN